jgi:glycosyltransferase involved in cell wall biosynthesis
MQLGTRPAVPFPTRYRDYRLVRSRGRVFGVPSFLDFNQLLHTEQFYAHPAILSARTRQDLEALIEERDADNRAENLGVIEGHNLVRHRGTLYAIPQGVGPVDLDLPKERKRAGVVAGGDLAEVQARLTAAGKKAPIEFAGWMPIYELVGNCGQHPQFDHTSEPPTGYRFTCSAPPPRKPTRTQQVVRWFNGKLKRLREVAWQVCRPLAGLFFGERVGPIRRLQVLGSVARMGLWLWRKGCAPMTVLRFLQTRHFQSQLLLAKQAGPVFFTSMPFTLNRQPWAIEIEDPTTLFFPFVHNGKTHEVDIRNAPCFPAVKALLESEQCRAVVTHMKATAEMVPTLFQSDIVRRKMYYRPLGVPLPPRYQRHQECSSTSEIHLLFINSWCQVPNNFYLRGGLDILEAFAILRERYPQVRLTMRTALPVLDDYYHRIIESGWVRVIQRFFTAEEMADIHANSHIFLLPAARVHIVSLLQAMSYGLAVVGSDGWGMEEYLRHEENGLIVKGRYGRTSWADEQIGMLREDYEPMYNVNPDVVEGIVEAVSRLVEDRKFRARMGGAARAEVENKFNLAQWNDGLKEVFDRAFAEGA